MLEIMEKTFSKAVTLTEIIGNTKTSLFEFYNLTEASFQIFLTSVPPNKLPILAPKGKRDYKNTSKCEIIMAKVLSLYHRKHCGGIPFRY